MDNTCSLMIRPFPWNWMKMERPGFKRKTRFESWGKNSYSKNVKAKKILICGIGPGEYNRISFFSTANIFGTPCRQHMNIQVKSGNKKWTCGINNMNSSGWKIERLFKRYLPGSHLSSMRFASFEKLFLVAKQFAICLLYYLSLGKTKLRQSLKLFLHAPFKIKHLGILYYFLGIKVLHTPSGSYCIGRSLLVIFLKSFTVTIALQWSLPLIELHEKLVTPRVYTQGVAGT